MSRFRAGLIGIVVIVVFTYLGFTKFANPLASQFTVHAVFPAASGIRPNSLVRIAGINVGKVTSISSEPGCSSGSSSCQAADVAMTIDDNGLPIHNDATFAIRPRTFLEGNFFVDVNPGSPSAPTVGDGHTFPMSQGTQPVQLDQILQGLQSDTRHNLQVLAREYGAAVKIAGPAYNASIPYWLPAYQYTAIVTHDALGTRPHDLSTWIDTMGTFSGALDAHPQNLQSVITDFNTTANAFARQNVALQNAVGELPRTLAAATPALTQLNAAIPPLEALSKALLPGVQTAGSTIDKSLPFISQLRQLVQPAELRGLVADLRVAVPSLAKLTQETIPLMRDGVRPLASCVANVIYPWSQLTINDSTFNASNGFPPRPVYVEAVDFLPGLAGESRNFDANGPYIRILGNGGTATYSLQPGFFGQSLVPLSAVQPAPPPGEKRPPYQPNVPCETQTPINQQTLQTNAGPPLTMLHTDLSAPGAALRSQSAMQGLVSMVRGLLKSQGSPLKVSSNVITSAAQLLKANKR